MSQLDGCWAKLTRAYEHLDALKGEIARHPKTTLFDTKLDANAGQFSYEVVKAPDIPIRWSTMIGDIIQNFRSCLDYLAYELVPLGQGGTHYEDSQFPIMSDYPRDKLGSLINDPWPTIEWAILNLTGWRGKRTYASLSDKHRALVQRYQPYQGDHIPRPYHHPFSKLVELSNRDKHRTLILSFVMPDVESISASISHIQDCEVLTWAVAGTALVPGAINPPILGKIKVTGPDPDVKVNYDFTPLVSVGELIPGLPHDVGNLLDFIGATIIKLVREVEPDF